MFRLSSVLSKASLCVSLLFLLVSQSHSEPVVVGLASLDYPPFYYSDQKRLRGASIEIAETVAEMAGYSLIYRRMPWKRIQKDLEKGSLDMVILYRKTPERAKDVIYTREPYIVESSHLFLAKDHALKSAQDLKTLSTYSFFYVRGYSHGAEFDEATYLQKTPVNNERELLERIASGRPFIGVGNKAALLYHARAIGLDEKIRFLEPPIDQSPNYMAVSRKVANAQQMADAFSAAFESYAKSPEYSAILERYGFQ